MSRAGAKVETRTLRVPPRPCVVPDHVFDAWGWCASDAVEWRTNAAWAPTAPWTLDLANPPELVFVLRDAERIPDLPRERASLHAVGYGLSDETWALAPYAIDDATDLLHVRRVPPRELLWIAAPSLPALVWGLHDWAHFHNHGPFDDPPSTELACDLLALEWLRENRGVLGLGDDVLGAVARDLAALTRKRFESAARPLPLGPDGRTCDVEALFAGPYPSFTLSLASL